MATLLIIRTFSRRGSYIGPGRDKDSSTVVSVSNEAGLQVLSLSYTHHFLESFMCVRPLDIIKRRKAATATRRARLTLDQDGSCSDVEADMS